MARSWDRAKGAASAGSVAAQAPVESGVVHSDLDRELYLVGFSLRRWFGGQPDSPAVRAAVMQCEEMMRFGEEGRGDVWMWELRESTRLDLLEAGYCPVRRDIDVWLAMLWRGWRKRYSKMKNENSRLLRGPTTWNTLIFSDCPLEKHLVVGGQVAITWPRGRTERQVKYEFLKDIVMSIDLLKTWENHRKSNVFFSFFQGDIYIPCSENLLKLSFKAILIEDPARALQGVFIWRVCDVRKLAALIPQSCHVVVNRESGLSA